MLFNLTSELFIVWLVASSIIFALAYVTYRNPLYSVLFLLLIGWIPLRFLTGGDKSLLASVGGINVEGIRLLAANIILGIYLLRNYKKVLQRIYYLLPYSLLIIWLSVTLLWSTDQLEGIRFIFKLVYPAILLLIILINQENHHDLKRNIFRILDVIPFLIISTIFLRWIVGDELFRDVIGFERFQGTLSQDVFALEAGFWVLYLFFRKDDETKLVNILLFFIFTVFLILTLSRTVSVTVIIILLISQLIWKQQSNKHLLVNILLISLILCGALYYNPLRQRFAPLIDSVVNLIHESDAEKEIQPTVESPNNLPDDPKIEASQEKPPKDIGSQTQSSSEERRLSADEVALKFATSGRSDVWKAALAEFRDHPIQGVGLGSVHDDIVEVSGGRLNTVLSEHIHILSEAGIIGYGLFIVGYGWIFFISLKNSPLRGDFLENQKDSNYTISKLAVVGLLFLAFTSLVDNTFNYYANVVGYVWVILGLQICDIPTRHSTNHEDEL